MSLTAHALAARADPAAAAVLHDALLERFGSLYGEHVRQALKDADAFGEAIEVRVQRDVDRRRRETSAGTRRAGRRC